MNKYTNMLNINKYINRIELNYEVIHQWLFFVIQNKRHRGDKNKCRVEPQKKKSSSSGLPVICILHIHQYSEKKHE